ncbi:hypothetical protein T439DRAFT_126916 [Meredithblackwellia eburnea MCA 4105]
MKAITLEEVLALPAAYGLPREIATYAEYYGPYMQQAYFQAYVTFAYNSYYVAEVFNYVVLGSAGLIMLLGLFLRFYNHLVATRKLPNLIVAIETFLTKHMVLSAGVGKQALEPIHYFGRRAKFATIQIPIRLHSFVAFTFVGASIFVAFWRYESLLPDVWYQDLGWTASQYVRGFADRTGIISFGLTPLLVVLAGRNSPVIFMTGCSYATLQIYHRWVARMAMVHGFAHGIAYCILEGWYSIPGGENYLLECFKESYWNWGWVAVAGGFFGCTLSLRRMREIAYETFLIVHILCAILWIVGCYYHVWFLDPDYSYLKYIYGSIAFWAFDRIARLARILYLNVVAFGNKRSGKVGSVGGEGYIVGAGDYIRLRVKMSTAWPASWGGPGTYVFISSPKLNIWESHPFTITWPAGMPAHLPAASPGGKVKGPVEAFEANEVDTERTFELVLKSYSGFTGKLKKALTSGTVSLEEGGPHPVAPLKLIVDGPYGHGVDVSPFESVLLISGGSGVSATVSHLADIAKRMVKKEGRFAVRRINVVWAVRETAALDVLVPYLQRLQSICPSASEPLITLDVYSTAGQSVAATDAEKGPVGSSASSTKSGSTFASLHSLFKPLSSFVTLRTHEGRPLVGPHIDDYFPFQEKRIAVSVCGPTGLCDATREAVKERMGNQGYNAFNLVYSEESFTW